MTPMKEEEEEEEEGGGGGEQMEFSVNVPGSSVVNNFIFIFSGV